MNTDNVRRQMVEQQIRTWDVFDAMILTVFENVPREKFVPAEFVDAAYADSEIPLPHRQCMLRPSIEGRILQSVGIDSGELVLEIGTGTGYLTACLAQLAEHVTSIDIFEDLCTGARKNLDDNEVGNVSVVCMDAMNRLPDGQFDVIVATGSTVELEQRFVDALNPGGRLFTVVGESPAKTAMLVKRGFGDAVESTALFETDIPALESISKPSTFSF